jgi:glutamate synthase (NADPH/NADH) small chain
MEKRHLNRRIEQMRAEGTKFRTGVAIGQDILAGALRDRYDAIVLAVGATKARDLPVPGRELSGIHQAMEYLPLSNKVVEGDYVTPPITAQGKHVIIIGGGDTGADCLGTATRQGAASVTQLEIMPRPADERPTSQPWPTYPMIYRVSSAHEELCSLKDGGDRVYAVNTTEFVGDEHGNVQSLRLTEVVFENGRFSPVPGTEREIPAQLVLLAMGFTGPEQDNGLVGQLGLELDARGNIKRDAEYRTNVDNVFVAGDAGRGQSLIVWAIAEGRSAAAAVDEYLAGVSALSVAIAPTVRPLTV